MVQKKAVKKVVKKGDVYTCGVCGLAVTVDEVCGCVDTCGIICCKKQMKPKKKASFIFTPSQSEFPHFAITQNACCMSDENLLCLSMFVAGEKLIARVKENIYGRP